MREKTIASSPKRMGRPPLNMKGTTVRLSEETMKRIDAQVGVYGRAQFIRDAIEEKLARIEKDRAAE